MTDLPDLSVVVPVFNEEAVLPVFHRELTAALAGASTPYEVIFVDDGSRDGTPGVLAELAVSDGRVRVVEFSRNFGHQSAMMAGLDHAGGRACVIMDGDLQDPPALLPQMLTLWREGFDVVYAVRRTRAGETAFKRVSAALFYRLINRLSGVAIPRDTGDFRLMDRRVVDVLRALPERNRFLRGLVAWIGFRQTGLPFDRPPRAAGETKFPLWKMVRFAVDGIAAFSHFPLRLVTFLGLACSAASLGVFGWVVAVWLSHRNIQGWTSLIGVVLFLGGAQLLALGVIGEYIGRIFDEAKGRPLYLVRQTRGFP